VAVAADGPTPLIDELHVCLLRALALHETSANRRMRRLDLALLDTTTWPEFVWDWLALMRDRHLLSLHYGAAGGSGSKGRRRRGSEGTDDSSGSGSEGDDEGGGAPAVREVAPEVKAEADAAVKQLEAAAKARGPRSKGAGGAPAGRERARKRGAPRRVDEAAIVWTDDEEDGRPVTRRRGPIGRKKAVPAAAPAGGAARPPASAAASRGASEEPERAAAGGHEGDAAPASPAKAAPAGEQQRAPAGTPPPVKRRKVEAGGGGGVAPPVPRAPRPPPPELIAAMRAARPGPGSASVSYWALTPRQRAAILARMCEDLLNSGLARTELDKREGAGMFHAGRGGAGGAFAMTEAAAAAGGGDGEDGDGAKDDGKPVVGGGQGAGAPGGPWGLQPRGQANAQPWEVRRARLSPARARPRPRHPPPSTLAAPRRPQPAIHLENPDAVDDGNADTCMVCGQGGSLLCCDACPAAYHSKCMGLNPRELPPKWQCPECAAGGRGEAAGLRTPMVGVDGGAGAVVWAAYGRLFLAHPRGALERGGGGGRGSDPGGAAAARRKGRKSGGGCGRGRGAHAILPDPEEVGLVMLTGKAAADKLAQIRRVTGGATPHPTALAAVEVRRPREGAPGCMGRHWARAAAPRPRSGSTPGTTPRAAPALRRPRPSPATGPALSCHPYPRRRLRVARPSRPTPRATSTSTATRGRPPRQRSRRGSRSSRSASARACRACRRPCRSSTSRGLRAAPRRPRRPSPRRPRPRGGAGPRAAAGPRRAQRWRSPATMRACPSRWRSWRPRRRPTSRWVRPACPRVRCGRLDATLTDGCSTQPQPPPVDCPLLLSSDPSRRSCPPPPPVPPQDPKFHLLRNHLIREEGDLWGLLEGDWAGPEAGLGGLDARRRWKERVQVWGWGQRGSR
jgi:hypothetical protein